MSLSADRDRCALRLLDMPDMAATSKMPTRLSKRVALGPTSPLQRLAPRSVPFVWSASLTDGGFSALSALYGYMSGQYEYTGHLFLLYKVRYGRGISVYVCVSTYD